MAARRKLVTFPIGVGQAASPGRSKAGPCAEPVCRANQPAELSSLTQPQHQNHPSRKS